MGIKYKNTLDKELIEASKIQWWHSQQKFIKTIAICIFISLIFLTWGLLKPSSSGFWNFKTTIGLAYAIIVLILLFTLYESRTKWLSNCKSAITTKNKTLIEYTFTNEKIIISQTNAYAESSWDIVTGYRIHNNFLFLYINSSQSSYFTIDRNDMVETDFTILLNFVINKIPLKK
jgi:hypothetical protein